jgi:branched-chain amino acid transport system substrate-binding protein
LARRPTDRSPRWRLAIIGAAAAAVAACAPLPRVGTATTTVAPHGSCDHARVVPVGAALDLSGPGATLGKEYLRGLELSVTQVNNSRGVLSSHACLELMYKNTRGSDGVASRAILDLANAEGAAFIVAPLTAGEIQAAGSDLARDGVPTASFSGLGAIYDPHRYPQLFPLAAPISVTAAAMTSFARARGWTRVGVIGTGDSDGVLDSAAAVDAVRHDGLALAASAVPSAATTLARLRAASPDAILLMGDAPGVIGVLEARARLGWDVPVVAESVAADPEVVAAVGPSGLGGVFAVVPRSVAAGSSPFDPNLVALRDQLRHVLGGSSLTGSILPYAEAEDAVSMFASTSNSVHTIAPGPVRTFLENASFQGVLASYSFTPDSHGGMGADQVTVVPVSSLADGLFGASTAG